MFTIVGLAVLTLVGLLAVGFLVVRLLVQLRLLREEVARTRADVEPRYREVRDSRARLDTR